MFWLWIYWQIEQSCDRGFWNAETDYYLNVRNGHAIPWQDMWKNKYRITGQNRSV
jgi:hypothetical protein